MGERGWIAIILRQVLSFGAKKFLEEDPALVFTHSSSDLYPVVEPVLCRKIKDRSTGTGLGIPCSKDEPRNTGLKHGPSAHGTWLQCHIEGRVGEAPGLQVFRRFSDDDHLGVGGGVL